MNNPYREGGPCWLAYERGYEDSVQAIIQKLRETDGDRLVYEQGYRDAIRDVMAKLEKAAGGKTERRRAEAYE